MADDDDDAEEPDDVVAGFGANDIEVGPAHHDPHLTYDCSAAFFSWAAVDAPPWPACAFVCAAKYAVQSPGITCYGCGSQPGGGVEGGGIGFFAEIGPACTADGAEAPVRQSHGSQTAVGAAAGGAFGGGGGGGHGAPPATPAGLPAWAAGGLGGRGRRFGNGPGDAAGGAGAGGSDAAGCCCAMRDVLGMRLEVGWFDRRIHPYSGE